MTPRWFAIFLPLLWPLVVSANLPRNAFPISLNAESGTGAYAYGTVRPHLVRSANGAWYTSDQNGNVVFRTGQRLEYDVNDRLSRVAGTNRMVTTFGYGSGDERLWESSGTNTLQVWIGGAYEEKNGQILYHILAGGRLVCTFDSTGTNVVQYYHPDHLTSSSIQTDSTGAVIQHYEYSAFGQSRYTQSSTAFPASRRYTSQVLDEDTGLYYYNFRYYDPVLGRFMQADDIIPEVGDPQSWNAYSYVRNNPLRFTDPDGHAPDDDDLDNIPMTLGGAHAILRQQESAASARLYNHAATELHNDAALGRMAAELNPIVGGVNAGYQLGTGNDAVDYHKLSTKERVLSGAQVAATVAPGVLKAGEAVAETASVLKNAAKGKAFAKDAIKGLEKTQVGVQEEVTVVTESGTRTRLDAIGRDATTGKVKISEIKSSAKAPLTKGQKAAHPEIRTSGATVV